MKILEQWRNDDLNDPLGHLFSLDSLERYYVEGLCNVFSANPLLFTEDVLLPITPFDELVQLCQCKNISSVYSITNGDRTETTPIKPATDSLRRWRGKSRCTPARAHYYTLDTSLGSLRIFPVVTESNLYLHVRCSKRPSIDSDVPCEIMPIIRQWVLYSAKMNDELAVGFREQALVHLSTYEKLLQIVSTNPQVTQK